MPKFEEMDAGQVVLGRGRANFQKRRPFVDAIKDAEAGRIELEKDDDPVVMKRLLRQASKEVGIKVRSSWEDDTRSALLWKRVSLVKQQTKPAAKPASAKKPGSRGSHLKAVG